MSNIVVPVLGESIVEARIAKWLKKPGDHVEVGEPLVELETEKTNVEVEAPASGRLARICLANGAAAMPGDILAEIADD